MKDFRSILVLEDGRCFYGRGIGAFGVAFGEVVFNTSMTGYQEIVSDPSYCGQIVTFTAPQIGNYGVCDLDCQAPDPVLSGIVIRELSPIASNWRSQGDLDAWLRTKNIVGICEVDTRALTRHIRDRGAMRAGIWSQMQDEAEMVELVRQSPSLVGADLTDRVGVDQMHIVRQKGGERARVVLIDFGVKQGIVQCLTQRGVAVWVVPADTSVKEILELAPSGLVLSNGPGDPAAVRHGIQTARELIGRLPILGICLGHQILGLAVGAKTLKLRFGHHGGNHPVYDKSSGQIWITAQNHGFAVDPDTLAGDDIEVTHRSLYDGTLEGFRSCNRKFLAVQFHPEACPGPSDAECVFDEFITMLGRNRAQHA